MGCSKLRTRSSSSLMRPWALRSLSSSSAGWCDPDCEAASAAGVGCGGVDRTTCTTEAMAMRMSGSVIRAASALSDSSFTGHERPLRAMGDRVG
eukprot:CAMPEP_0174728586 /NCGR_PEP_ID=MMETSP1094-20130205/51988_1 /TAXON_ID=156173 /ORGANISM="Chrysochromulina brevifilum, Strain UTEX LB 985" /LENGTH=93 /DNA_ID=CAMNT_0015930539 /DNA_START=224 /DNA_END=505 /DNA_ORIENTATION=+